MSAAVILLFAIATIVSSTNLQICTVDYCDMEFQGPHTFSRTIGPITLRPGVYAHTLVSRSTGYDLHYESSSTGLFATVVYEDVEYSGPNGFLSTSGCIWNGNQTGSIFELGSDCLNERRPAVAQNQKWHMKKLKSDMVHVISFNMDSNNTVVLNSVKIYTVDYGLAAGAGYIAGVVVLVVVLGAALCVRNFILKRRGKGELPEERPDVETPRKEDE